MKQIHGNSRFMELEGLRGIAAIAVVIYHTLLAFYPAMFFGLGSVNAPVQNMKLEDNLHGLPLMAFFSGTFAVSIFFVLSGFVLTIGFFQSKKMESVKKLALKRYLRLMLPALASVTLAWILISLSLSHNQTVALETHSPWLAANWNLIPNFMQAMREGVWGIFAAPSSQYNGVLWTMHYEFVGSFVVFLLAMMVGRDGKRWIVYIGLLLALYQTWYLGFIFGMMLADAHASGWFEQFKNRKLGYLVLGAGVFFGGYPYDMVQNTIYRYLNLPFVSEHQLSFYTAVGAAMVISSIFMIPRLAKMLSGKKISGLGKYTFSLYLVHKPVLFTLGTGVFSVLITSYGYNKSVAITLLTIAPVIALVSILFEKYIDQPSIIFSGRVTSWYLAPVSSVSYRHIAVGYQSRFVDAFRSASTRTYGYLLQGLGIDRPAPKPIEVEES